MYTKDSARMLIMSHGMETAGFPKRLAGMQKGTLIMRAVEDLLDLPRVSTLEFAAPCLPPDTQLRCWWGGGFGRL